MPQHRFRLPDRDRSQARWGVVSILVHGLLAVFLLTLVGGRVATRKTVRYIDLGVPSGARQVALPSLGDGPPSVPLASRPAPEPSPSSDARVLPRVDIAPEVAPIGVSPPKFSDYDPVLGMTPRIGLDQGDGRFWVRPLDARLGITGASDPLTHAAKVDSAVTARILAFIDTMPPDSFAAAKIPKWMATDENGKTWGVDGNWVYLGDFKIPSAILALIPAPQGNYYQAKDAEALARVREQIIYSARVANNRADFKKYVKEIRKRKDAEREARKKARKLAEEAAKKPAKKDTIKP
ncbi:MAG: hypothetical protein ACE5HT_16380 [Gemmatimonadales bacterium]